MAIRTVDFLPEIFQTTPNKQFLSATLDQLVQEPSFKKTQGYIGRKVGPGVNPNDYYVLEPDATRANYQLEPGVVSLDPAETSKIKDVITYPGISDALSVQGANVAQSDRLYTSDYYCWDPFVNFDKFVNYSQYYWLPAGPDAVDVFATAIPLSDSFVVSRTNAYKFSGVIGTNPVITLVRGGNYTFELNQPGHQFWIQTDPGIAGRLPYAPNISSRDVLGVTNNGEDLGTVTFYVPQKDAQQFYYDLATIGNVDLLSDLSYEQLNGQYLSDIIADYGGIDGINNLNNKTLVFSVSPNFPTNQLWQIQYTYDINNLPVINVYPIDTINTLTKFNILFGNEYASTTWYNDASNVISQVPLLTAAKDVLYYQDSTNPDIFGQIRLVEQEDSSTINIDTDILGKQSYTSPNGVVFTNNLKVQFLAPVIPETYTDQEYYVAGVGTASQLLPVTNFVTPETYTQSAT